MKNVLITGSGCGLGKELAKYFALKNWNVIATMIFLDEGAELSDIPNINCYELDVTSTESIEKAKSLILTDYPQIDIVINNAGVGYRSFVELADDDKIKSIVAVNWLGVVKICRAFIPVFRQQDKGHFINITSVAGLVNLPLGSFYSSTKTAVESFSECMAYELMAFNIKVSTVQFGNIPTNFQKNVTKSDTTNISSYNKLMDRISKTADKKSNKNTDTLLTIVTKIFNIAEYPSNNFRRYTIGFDANFIKCFRHILGYKLFNYVIRKLVL